MLTLTETTTLGDVKIMATMQPSSLQADSPMLIWRPANPLGLTLASTRQVKVRGFAVHNGVAWTHNLAGDPEGVLDGIQTPEGVALSTEERAEIEAAILAVVDISPADARIMRALATSTRGLNEELTLEARLTAVRARHQFA